MPVQPTPAEERRLLADWAARAFGRDAFTRGVQRTAKRLAQSVPTGEEPDATTPPAR